MKKDGDNNPILDKHQNSTTTTSGTQNVSNDAYSIDAVVDKKNRLRQTTWTKNGLLHNDSGDDMTDRPAKIKYDKKRRIIYKKWAINGRFERYYETKPALIKLSKNKKEIIYKWYEWKGGKNVVIETKKETVYPKNFYN